MKVNVTVTFRYMKTTGKISFDDPPSWIFESAHKPGLASLVLAEAILGQQECFRIPGSPNWAFILEDLAYGRYEVVINEV